MLKIGIIKEEKSPPDSRVPLNPSQCKHLINNGFDILVQKSNSRCFSNQDYLDLNIPMAEDISNQDILLGVKEVPIESLIENKTYFFFSHTIKEQAYNQKLLKEIVRKKIHLVDYEVLTDINGQRVIAFGKFAGMVGAHNALWTYGKRTKLFDLPRMNSLYDYTAAQEIYRSIKFPPVKIVLTGTGRVSGGSELVLKDMGFTKVRPIDFVTKNYNFPIFTQLSSFYYAKRKDGKEFDNVQDFYDNPSDYESDFNHFIGCSDIMINGIYWDNKAPAFFTLKQMAEQNFKIKVIADVTCDIAPVSSIPSTIKASTISDPVFGYDPVLKEEVKPFTESAIDMMTIDNLPNELPRDASTAFGNMFIKQVLPELSNPQEGNMIDRASIAKYGNLGKNFEYLRNYLEN